MNRSAPDASAVTGSKSRCRVAGVPEQLRRLGVLLARLDLRDLRFEVAVADEQVEPAVEVVVEEERAELQREAARPGQPDGQRGVGEPQPFGRWRQSGT